MKSTELTSRGQGQSGEEDASRGPHSRWVVVSLDPTRSITQRQLKETFSEQVNVSSTFWVSVNTHLLKPRPLFGGLLIGQLAKTHLRKLLWTGSTFCANSPLLEPSKRRGVYPVAASTWFVHDRSLEHQRPGRLNVPPWISRPDCWRRALSSKKFLMKFNEWRPFFLTRIRELLFVSDKSRTRPECLEESMIFRNLCAFLYLSVRWRIGSGAKSNKNTGERCRYFSLFFELTLVLFCFWQLLAGYHTLLADQSSGIFNIPACRCSKQNH